MLVDDCIPLKIKVTPKHNDRLECVKQATKTKLVQNRVHIYWDVAFFIMMTSSNGNIFRVIDPLCEEFTGHRWIPLAKASDAELWCFPWSAPWINGWVNNREAGDFRRNPARYDVIVM